MPYREALGTAETQMIEQVLAFYREQKNDPGYQGAFEKMYTEAFVSFMGGGYADAVATGTAALYIAIAALELPKKSEILVSPVTDPGTISAIILNGHIPRLMDSMPKSYNIGVEHLLERISPNTKAVIVVHALGQACDVRTIVEESHKRGLKVVEDCSQAHGAKVMGRPVGTFGDIAAFSTMYRKAHITGASGGVVYSRDLNLFRLALAHADRGKPIWRPGFNDRNPNEFLFPALNLHTDEISCGIGLASLSRLNDTIVRRLTFVAGVSGRVWGESKVCEPYGYSPSDSPFIYPISVDESKISCGKVEFANAIEKEGIGLNPHYQYLVAEWPWVQSYLSDDFMTVNAKRIRDQTFNLYLNENYGESEVADVAAAIAKVENYYTK
jgi:dTDP-4-amino-4,6-dideoxygalactose transaminase